MNLNTHLKIYQIDIERITYNLDQDITGNMWTGTGERRVTWLAADKIKAGDKLVMGNCHGCWYVHSVMQQSNLFDTWVYSPKERTDG